MNEPLAYARDGGSITVSPAALSRIVVRAAERADGVHVRRPRRGLEVVHEDGHVSVTVALAAAYGAGLPEVARGVQERVASALATMCEVEVDAVDVTVEELVG